MKFIYKKIPMVLCAVFVLFSLSACGYTLLGTRADTRNSVLGTGDKTIAITKIEQSSLFPWLSYSLRTELHTEMNMRRLAKWVDVEKADYTMEAVLTSFEKRAYISGDDDETLLNLVAAQLTVTVYDKEHKTVWTSGPVTYSENYENIREEEAIHEIIRELVYIVYDRMQSTF